MCVEYECKPNRWRERKPTKGSLATKKAVPKSRILYGTAATMCSCRRWEKVLMLQQAFCRNGMKVLFCVRILGMGTVHHGDVLCSAPLGCRVSERWAYNASSQIQT